MWPAFPTSDYYDGSAPPGPHRPTVCLPAIPLVSENGRAEPDGSRVRFASVDGGGTQLFSGSLATGTPQTFPVASILGTVSLDGVAPSLGRARAADQPIST